MTEKKTGKDAAAKKDLQTKPMKVERGFRFLSVFSGDGKSLIFRNYPSKEETNVKLEVSDGDLGKLIRKAYQAFKPQAK